ncbi:MAG: hypothetical protein AB7P21_07080 [Lautropia sp.]
MATEPGRIDEDPVIAFHEAVLRQDRREQLEAVALALENVRSGRASSLDPDIATALWLDVRELIAGHPARLLSPAEDAVGGTLPMRPILRDLTGHAATYLALAEAHRIDDPARVLTVMEAFAVARATVLGWKRAISSAARSQAIDEADEWVARWLENQPDDTGLPKEALEAHARQAFSRARQALLSAAGRLYAVEGARSQSAVRARARKVRPPPAAV